MSVKNILLFFILIFSVPTAVTQAFDSAATSDRAIEAYASGRYSTASQLFELEDSVTPLSDGGLFLLANSYLHTVRPEMALATLQRLVSPESIQVDYLSVKGQAYIALGMMNEAADCLESSLSKFEHTDETYLNLEGLLCFCLNEAGRHQESAEEAMLTLSEYGIKQGLSPDETPAALFTTFPGKNKWIDFLTVEFLKASYATGKMTSEQTATLLQQLSEKGNHTATRLLSNF